MRISSEACKLLSSFVPADQRFTAKIKEVLNVNIELLYIKSPRLHTFDSLAIFVGAISEYFLRQNDVTMIKFGGLVLVLSCAAYLVSGVPQLGRDYDIGKHGITQSFYTFANNKYFVSSSGDECQVKDGSKGTCTIDKDCPYVIDLLKRNKSRDIVKCGFSGRYSIVCCKSSDKFSKLLCKENVDKIPSKPVR